MNWYLIEAVVVWTIISTFIATHSIAAALVGTAILYAVIVWGGWLVWPDPASSVLLLLPLVGALCGMLFGVRLRASPATATSEVPITAEMLRLLFLTIYALDEETTAVFFEQIFRFKRFEVEDEPGVWLARKGACSIRIVKAVDSPGGGAADKVAQRLTFWVDNSAGLLERLHQSGFREGESEPETKSLVLGQYVKKGVSSVTFLTPDSDVIEVRWADAIAEAA